MSKELYVGSGLHECSTIIKKMDLVPFAQVLVGHSKFKYVKWDPRRKYKAEPVLHEEIGAILAKYGLDHEIGSQDTMGKKFGFDRSNSIGNLPVKYYFGNSEIETGVNWEFWEPLKYSEIMGPGQWFPSGTGEFKDGSINIFLEDILGLWKHFYKLARPAFGWIGELMGPSNTRKAFQIERRIPRIWWTNFYGPPYVEKYGKDFLLNAPGYKIEELDDGGVYYQVTKDFYLWDDSGQGPTVEEIENYFKSHPLIKRIRYRPILARNYLPKGYLATRPREKVIKNSEKESKLTIKDLSIQKIMEAAKDAIEVSKNRWEIDLDFTPKSIERLEKAINTLFEPGHEPFVTTVYCLGAYLGEVVRKNLGGEWKFHKDLDEVVLTNIGNKGIEFWPFNRIKKRFALGRENSLVTFYQALEKTVKKKQ